MPARKVYHVPPDTARGWQVQAEDATRPSGMHATKAGAVARPISWLVKLFDRHP